MMLTLPAFIKPALEYIYSVYDWIYSAVCWRKKKGATTRTTQTQTEQLPTEQVQTDQEEGLDITEFVVVGVNSNESSNSNIKSKSV